jgi:hypothetical protein
MTNPKVNSLNRVAGFFAGVLVVAIIAVAAFGIWAMAHREPSHLVSYTQTRVRINGFSVFAQVPSTAALQEQGLAGRTVLADNQGMLWRYQPPVIPTYWMKGMRLSLDFIWIANQQVVDLTANVPVPTDSAELPRYRPAVPVTEVLEVPAGFIQRHQVKIGTKVTFFAL